MSPTARYWVRTVFGLKFWSFLAGLILALLLILLIR
jgi:hypothetical protein